jgi:hypothetical protein
MLAAWIVLLGTLVACTASPLCSQSLPSADSIPIPEKAQHIKKAPFDSQAADAVRGQQIQILFQTDDKVEDVLKFYRESLPRSGWRDSINANTANDLHVVWSNDCGFYTLGVIAKRGIGGQTDVELQFIPRVGM